MSGPSGVLHGADADGASLAQQLDEIAASAKRASTFAEGEYIPQLSRQHELKAAFTGAGRATEALETLAPRIAMLDGGEDGLRLAKAAIDNLDAGRQALRDGVHTQDDVLRGGAVVADMVATGAARSHFREAGDAVHGIAGIAAFEATSAADMFRAITSGAH